MRFVSTRRLRRTGRNSRPPSKTQDSSQPADQRPNSRFGHGLDGNVGSTNIGGDNTVVSVHTELDQDVIDTGGSTVAIINHLRKGGVQVPTGIKSEITGRVFKGGGEKVVVIGGGIVVRAGQQTAGSPVTINTTRVLKGQVKISAAVERHPLKIIWTGSDRGSVPTGIKSFNGSGGIRINIPGRVGGQVGAIGIEGHSRCKDGTIPA